MRSFTKNSTLYDFAPELLKEWLSSRDEERTRKSHFKIDGTRIPIDEKFILQNRDGTTVEMSRPGDPEGTAEQVINCRCTLGFTRKEQ